MDNLKFQTANGTRVAFNRVTVVGAVDEQRNGFPVYADGVEYFVTTMNRTEFIDTWNRVLKKITDKLLEGL